MARKGKRKFGSGMYARPVIAGNSTITLDLSTVLVPKTAYDSWKDTVGSTERHYLSISPTKLRSMARLLSCDAVKITSIIVSPGGASSSGIDVENTTIDFVDGQNFICADAMKPTKVKPSKLSPAGRYQDGTSSAEIVRIYCSFHQTGTAGAGGEFYTPFPKIVINISVRTDAYPTQLTI